MTRGLLRVVASGLLSASLARSGAAAPNLSPDSLLRNHLWRDLTSRPKGRRPTVGVVLSAGSLRGVAHIGVLSVLEDAGFPIDVVAGTSMGAVIGSLYAGGRPISRLVDLAKKLTYKTGNNANTFRLVSLMLADKLLSSERLEELVRGELGGLRFEQLPKAFACVAMDLYTGESLIFREGDVAPAVRASMNLPGVFAPVEYRHRYLVDGGVVDYIPIGAAKLLGAEWVLASITEPNYRATKPRSVFESLEQVIDIRGAFVSREQRKLANFLIEPQVGDIGLYETARAGEAVTKGVLAANQGVKAAMESLLLFSLPRLAADYGPGGEK